jgi:hypothetical protein
MRDYSLSNLCCKSTTKVILSKNWDQYRLDSGWLRLKSLYRYSLADLFTSGGSLVHGIRTQQQITAIHWKVLIGETLFNGTRKWTWALYTFLTLGAKDATCERWMLPTHSVRMWAWQLTKPFVISMYLMYSIRTRIYLVVVGLRDIFGIVKIKVKNS